MKVGFYFKKGPRVQRKIDKNCVSFNQPKFSFVVYIGVLNDYLVHSSWGLHLGSRFFTKWRLLEALMGLGLECCHLDYGEVVVLLSLFALCNR